MVKQRIKQTLSQIANHKVPTNKRSNHRREAKSHQTPRNPVKPCVRVSRPFPYSDIRVFGLFRAQNNVQRNTASPCSSLTHTHVQDSRQTDAGMRVDVLVLSHKRSKIETPNQSDRQKRKLLLRNRLRDKKTKNEATGKQPNVARVRCIANLRCRSP